MYMMMMMMMIVVIMMMHSTSVQGPAESEEGGSWAVGVCQGGDDDDVQVRPEDR